MNGEKMKNVETVFPRRRRQKSVSFLKKIIIIIFVKILGKKAFSHI